MYPVAQLRSHSNSVAHGLPARCCAPARHSRQWNCADSTPLRFFKVKFRSRIWSLGGRPMHRHRSLPTTLPRTRARPRLQPTPDAAPTDQLHHLPGSSHCGNGVRVCSGEGVVPKTRSNKLFWSRQQVFVGHSDWCANVMEETEELDSRHFLRLHWKGAWSAALRRALGSGRIQRRDCCGRGDVSAAFSGQELIFPASAPVASWCRVD